MSNPELSPKRHQEVKFGNERYPAPQYPEGLNEWIKNHFPETRQWLVGNLQNPDETPTLPGDLDPNTAEVTV